MLTWSQQHAYESRISTSTIRAPLPMLGSVVASPLPQLDVVNKHTDSWVFLSNLCRLAVRRNGRGLRAPPVRARSASSLIPRLFLRARQRPKKSLMPVQNCEVRNSLRQYLSSEGTTYATILKSFFPASSLQSLHCDQVSLCHLRAACCSDLPGRQALFTNSTSGSKLLQSEMPLSRALFA